MSTVNSHGPFLLRGAGFTLLEMLIALFVLVILVTAAGPSFSNMIEKQKTERAVMEIEWLFVQAKSEAVMRGSPVVVSSSGIPKENAGGKALADWTITAQVSGSGEIIARVMGDQFSNLPVESSFTKPVEFDPLTGIPASSGSLLILPDNIGLKIKVTVNNMTGRIYTCEVNGKGGYGKCRKKYNH